jgi:hypothetical protein
VKMPEIQGYYGGKTWAGATPPYRSTAMAAAALVAPAHVLSETDVRPLPVLTEYQTGPQVGPKETNDE